MAYTGQPWASHKEARLCFAMQDNMGTAAVTGFEEIPTKEDCDIDVSPSYNFFQHGGGYRGKTWYSDTGDTVEGKMVLPCSSGYVASGLIYNWLFGRQASSYYYQGYYATIFKVINLGLTNEFVEMYQDVKVTKGSLKLDTGLDYLTFEVDLKAMSLPVTTEAWPGTVGQTFIDGTLYPYKFQEAAFAIDTGSGYAASVVTKNHTLSWDNMLEDVDSLDGSTTIYDAPSTEWADWTVSFDQWYTSSAIRAAFLAGTEGKYKATLARAAGNTATFEIPRLKWTAAPLKVGTGGLVKQEGISLQALVPLSGDETTQACLITEAATS
jgi:hypothetical protein